MNRSRTLHRFLAVAVLLLAGSRALPAQQTALVPLSDWAYRDLDRLNALGLLDSAIIGQRPYSEREVDRLVVIARRAAMASPRAGAEAEIVDETLRRLERRFGMDGGGRRGAVALFDDATLVGSSTDAQRRGLLGINGQYAETTIDPLADRRLGEPVVTGQTLALELAQRIEPLSWLAVTARERVEGRRPRDGSLSTQHAELLRASARALYRNLALTVGREQFGWAQRPGDGFFLASDAPALDQVSLASDHPFALPGFLRRLGPAAGTIIVADLGASVARSHSKLLSYKVSVEPTSNLEIGATVQDHFGGVGNRHSSALDQFIDFIPLLDLFRRHNYYDTSRPLEVQSDKRLGVDARMTFPRLGGVVVATELLIDDFDVTRLSALATNDGSQSIAVLLPRLGSPRVSLDLTAKHMGIYTSTHTPFTDGMTTRGRLLGDELGADAKAFGAVLGWQPSGGTRLSIDGRTAIYSDVVYTGDFSPTGNGEVHKESSNPDELRDRLIVSAAMQSSDNLRLWARVGGERIRHSRVGAHAYVAEIGMGWQP